MEAIKRQTFTGKVKSKILGNEDFNFDNLALEVFRWQAKHVPIYKEYIGKLGVEIELIDEITKIPFLPIQFFKNKVVSSQQHKQPSLIFESSGTTTSTTSKHYVYDASFAKKVSKKIFEEFYGSLNDYQILALLPSYLERNNSSLVFMVDYFMQYASEGSGFYLDNFEALIEKLQTPNTQKSKKILIGVTFALLDLAEKGENYHDILIMETGGMKGRRKEIVRSNLHDLFKEQLKVDSVHSEYGMTELTSQAYSKGNGIFKAPHWMKILVREASDPFCITTEGSGGINVIDLANIESCAFIETQDLGRIFKNGTFEVMGRFDNSDVRGCNLMVS